MSRKKQPVYPPLALLKKTTARYPDIWRKLELAHASNSVDNVSPWQRWCYVPISVTLAAAADIDKPADLDSWCLTAEAASILAALAPWRLSKEVFVFDPEIQQLLFSQSGDLQITPDSLLQLPYHCFYIQFAGAFDLCGNNCHGVFVHLEDNPEDNISELCLLYLLSDARTASQLIRLDADTIDESIRINHESAMRVVEPGRDDLLQQVHTEAAQSDALAEALRCTLQLVLYLCAQNAEITSSPEQASHTKRSSAGVIVDRYAEIRKWDVGIRVGNAVRNYRRQQETTPVDDLVRTHASPRPHMRRGHWHHFWAGPKNKPAERKLILQWVAPTFVTASHKGDTPVVLHRVDLPDTGDHPPKA